MSLIVLFISSCQKESEALDVQNPVEAVKTTKANPISYLRTWYDNGGDDFGCRGINGTCSEDVIIAPPETNRALPNPKEALNAVIEQVHADNTEGLIATIQANYDVLSDIFGESTLKSIINNNAKLAVKGSLADNSTAFFLISENNEIIQVIPIRIE